MKILFTADWHINQNRPKIPKAWQAERYKELISQLNQVECDLHIIGGDIFDVESPSLEDIELYHDLVHSMAHETLVFTGNHEMISKRVSALKRFARATNYNNPKVSIVHAHTVLGTDYDIIAYDGITTKFPATNNKLCFTHVRGEIPPHVTPEVDLDKFAHYDLVLAGDLHSHKNSQRNIVYPGSPLTTSFHRNEVSGSNGYIVVDTDTLEWEWHELKLPQLIRKTVTTEEEMVETDFHHTVYEFQGDALALKGLSKDTPLLDKKIITNISEDPTLDLAQCESVEDELTEYLINAEGIEDPSPLISRYTTCVKGKE